MKTRKMKNLLLLILTTLMLVLISTSCSEKQPDMTTQEAYVNNNVSQYIGYDFWEKENELRLFCSRQSHVEENQEEEDIQILRLVEPTKAQQQYVVELRQGLIWYFLTINNIDVASKTQEQEVMFYETNETEETILGYINKNNPNVIMLSVNLMENGEKSHLFNETYIMLTLKQLGFQSTDAVAITEGIVNALTERILNFMSQSSPFQESYNDATKIAHQLLEADLEIVKCYLGDAPSSVIDRINDKLKDVPRAYCEEPNPAGRMENILAIMDRFCDEETVVFAGEPHCLLFEAQEIARAYCKECKPSKETIDYIRKHYIISDFEKLKVRIDPDEGNRLE